MFQHRQMAALFLRRVISIYWNEIDEASKEQSREWVNSFTELVKSQILLALQREPFNLARRAICGVVSKLASMELAANRWQEILVAMNNVRVLRCSYQQFLSSSQPSDRELGLLLLYSLHEIVSKYVTTENLLSVLQNGLRDTDPSVGSQLSS